VTRRFEGAAVAGFESATTMLAARIDFLGLESAALRSHRPLTGSSRAMADFGERQQSSTLDTTGLRALGQPSALMVSINAFIEGASDVM